MSEDLGTAAVLAACLRAYRDAPAPARARRGPVTLGEAAGLALAASRPAGGVKRIMDDPVRAALRSKVECIGWRLYAEGGLRKMARALELTRQAMAEDPDYAASKLEAWWHGIGVGADVWLN